MPIHFKFFSAKEYDSFSVDSSVISVDALKQKIVELKYKSKSNSLCLGTDLDLVVVNAQTNDCYADDMLIPNNTRVLIRRVPGSRRRKPIDNTTIVVREKQRPLSSSYCTGSNSSKISSETAITASCRSNPANTGVSSVCSSTVTSLSTTKPNGGDGFRCDDGFGDDVFVIPRMKPVQHSKSTVDAESDEDSKIKALVNAPALEWRLEGSNGVKNGRGFSGLVKKIPPEGYVCHRCKVRGHFIQDCPTNGDPNYDCKRLRPPTGIPKSMLMPNRGGSYVFSSGATAVLQPNYHAFEKEIFGCLPSKRSWSASDLPPELLCPLCKQVIKDAVLTSKCCFKSFCDKCIRVHLITSKLKCVCGATNILTDYLIPNMTLRDTINCIVKSGPCYSSSGENAKRNSFQDKDMELAHCSEPQISTTKLSAESFQEEQKPSPGDVEDGANKRKLIDAPHQTTKKARTTGATNVSEDTIGPMRMKDTASQGGVMGVEEKVQQKEISSEVEKKKDEREVVKGEIKQKVVCGARRKKKRERSQDVETESYMMPIGSYAYNPYWVGAQVGLEGYMAPYYAAGAMIYGLSSFGTSFNGLMNQYTFSMQ
ncbi:E3 ubiquitin ligase PARAQUAT TOLERANCE 3-like [Hevea brasiliensis]|uniref:E3 ubiquitin ligase PARAQUAT TOLERANCE 3-like n=1 Tax=Hevea brasiliensis TaxID=3981 RepID=UPI0025CFE1F4|nr:E3 ubiquitin ligase PARAQUAT TOLERANCE 3-like [Hevea brasiliensis]